MAQSKTYRAVRNLELHTYIEVQGKQVYIPFTGGSLSPRVSNGTYSTNNPLIQKALESSPRYKRDFICISASPIIEKKAQPQDQVIQDEAQEEEAQGETELKAIEDITTVQDAKDFLARELAGVSKASLTNKTKVLEVAAQHGYDFPALKL